MQTLVLSDSTDMLHPAASILLVLVCLYWYTTVHYKYTQEC